MKKAAPTEVKSSPRKANHTTLSAQRHRLLERLKRGPIDTLLARRDLNMFHPAARVQELREQGHEIHTQRITLIDEHGHTHSGVALYTLIRLAKGWV